MQDQLSVSPHLSHRKEIDGLRALAISGVLLFHFFPNTLPLGYLGVDLFFVISGFLITHLINKQLLANQFSFFNFYLKRIRRILPAMLAMLIATSVAAVFILLAPDLERYAQSQLATLGFFANIYFWRTGGYFSTSDELKPLLHMWSLGVEEQYYLFFPAILIFIFKIFRNYQLRLASLFIIILCSYSLNIYITNIGGSNPAFFLLPTRIWQFSIGSFFALHVPKLQTRNFSPDLISWIGLILIILNFIFPIPQLPSASLMVIGAGLILWNKLDSDSTFNRLLVTKPIQNLGLFSFSIYLLHWPILVFLKYIYVDHLPIYLLAFGLLATILLSYCSWKYIENPFRKIFSTKVVFIFIFIFYPILIGYSIFILSHKGLPNRDSSLANSIASAIDSNYRCPADSYRIYGASRSCLIGDTKELPFLGLLGNSHAQMYAPAVINLLKDRHQSGLIIPLNGCLPTIDLNISMECLKMAQMNYQTIIADTNLKTIIIAMTWYSDNLVDKLGNQISDSDFKLREKSIISLIYSLSKAEKDIYLVGPIAIPNFDLASIVSRELKFKNENTPTFIPREIFDKQFNSILSSLSAQLKHKLIAPHEIFCDQRVCNFADFHGSFFSDSTHLSFYGAQKVTNSFAPIFEAQR